MKNLESLITDQETWTSAEGSNDGVIFLLRFRPNLQAFISTEKYNERITLTWNYDSDDSSLMPTEKEMELMEKVENSLVDVLENDLQAILSFVYLGDNQKQWHWYSSNVEETGKRINDALSDFEILPIELSSEEDPKWSEYNAVIDGADDSDYEELAEK
ncbi:DUF695 domain-containing protein [Kaistella flava (ex Peng et al. 2021)]|uniref:DUF695 domain-containing protein n=1 Tax=Kaistella flava (ex Peng et al. 2021) TaxID=2038776 RepID=A0A7M2Y963_9FLAO|nr:DUF695 domain-containing protein [Kaistella flava (ex Peng et al. 2021)]QOW09883.1 DUF695 domain-containing protein [Kaistella flava (ex Peng et al. 2021)]